MQKERSIFYLIQKRIKLVSPKQETEYLIYYGSH